MNSENDDRDDGPSRAVIVKEIVAASAGILVLLGGLKHLAGVVPAVGDHAFTVAAAAQLYVPLYLIGRRGITRTSLGLSFSAWKRDLAMTLVLVLVVTVPFAAGHHLWQTLLFGRPFRLRMPQDLGENVFVQLFVVALAEETFFRGYLQERMQRLWPTTRTILGLPMGRAIVVSSAVFALAHFVGEYRPDRLGPFFPALVFGAMRTRTNTIVGAALFHAFCNLLGDVLFAFYRAG